MAWGTVLRALAPDVVVYDTLVPAEPEHEPLPSSARVGYVLRRCRPERHAEIAASPFLARVDAIVVPHTEEEFGYRLSSDLADKALFAGLIARRPDPARQGELRRRYGLGSEGSDVRLLVSTAGGGGFAHSALPFFDSVAAVHRRLTDRTAGDRLRHVVVLGPHFTGATELPALPGASVVAAEPALVDLFALADLAVAEGGYNWLSELRLVKTPAVFLPGRRTLDDQEERVRQMERRGLALVFVGQPREVVAEAVVDLLRSPARLAAMRARHVDDDVVLGNLSAAEHLLGHLSDRAA